METGHSDPWFDIANEVNSLLASPGIKQRFRDRVNEAMSLWLQRFDEKRRREESRTKTVEQQGVRCGSEQLPDKDKSKPPDGTFHWVVNFHDGKPPMEAWIAADLSPQFDPDDSPPLTVPASRPVSLAEKYAVLAAVWDSRWTGDDKIDPWAEMDFCRESEPYKSLVTKLHGNFYGTELTAKDAVVVRSWITDVGGDCSAANAIYKTSPQRRGRKKADYETIRSEAELAAAWQRAHETGTYKPEFAKEHGMTAVEFDRLLDRVAGRKRASE